uniref:60S ribosomal protein L7a n=1 Tax=Salix viminalis TaxID=40686 RepID=A0A6N2NFD0_SALVM
MAPKRGVKAPLAAKKKPEKVVNPLFEKRPKQFGIGGALPPKKDLTRFVKWPHVVRIQRQRRILKQPTQLFKLLLKYRPEDKAAKKERLLKRAQAEEEGKTVESKKPIVVKYGLNHVTYLIEQIVHKKTASVLCLTSVKNEDKLEFSRVLEAVKANFNDKFDEHRKKWGGGIMGSKSLAKSKAKERVIAKEVAQRMS